MTASSVHGKHDSQPIESGDATNLLHRFCSVRQQSLSLCEPLQVEDYLLQSMPDASPAKWHLAHTTWFFETFLLSTPHADYAPFHAAFAVLFNSYYHAVGARHPRPQRGLLSRPSVAEVQAYRRHVDEAVTQRISNGLTVEHARVLELGLQHEQQHQELLLTDIKHALGHNPLYPSYSGGKRRGLTDASAVGVASAITDAQGDWHVFDEGITEIGYGGNGFCFDNERPRHRVFLQPFRIANHLVTQGEFLDFMQDGGYEQSRWWLSDGWDACQSEAWDRPLYWLDREGTECFTLDGIQPIALNDPVCHISYYEADAFARWRGARLPTETEWERAAVHQIASDDMLKGHFVENGHYHPRAPSLIEPGIQQMFGTLWEWTASPYVPYPGYQPPDGALGEYNGKFMCNQMVLRGGSCASPRSHLRATYRNFFHPEKRWQFSGIRLAADA